MWFLFARSQRAKKMAEVVHKYFCSYCRLYVFGETPTLLASIVNSHNRLLHPIDFASWTPEGITQSTQYSGPASVPPYLASYVTPVSKEWGDAKAPDITDRDKIFLVTNGIRW
jgi:hypothetical protein